MEVNVLGQGGQNNITSLGAQNSSKVSNGEYSPPVRQVNDTDSVNKEVYHGDKKDKISEELMKKSVDKLNKFLEGESTHVVYERHDKLKSQFVIKIVDNKTQEVVKEIPPKKILDMVAEMCRLAGVIFDEKA